MGKLQRVRLKGAKLNADFRKSESTLWDEWKKKHKTHLKAGEVVLFLSSKRDQLFFVLGIHEIDPMVYAHTQPLARITQEEVQAMRTMRKEGYSSREIAEELGRSNTSVLRYTGEKNDRDVTIAKAPRTGVRVMDTRKWRITGGLWNPDFLQNYANSMGLHIEGKKRVEELYAERNLRKLLESH